MTESQQHHPPQVDQDPPMPIQESNTGELPRAQSLARGASSNEQCFNVPQLAFQTFSSTSAVKPTTIMSATLTPLTLKQFMPVQSALKPLPPPASLFQNFRRSSQPGTTESLLAGSSPLRNFKLNQPSPPSHQRQVVTAIFDSA